MPSHVRNPESSLSIEGLGILGSLRLTPEIFAAAKAHHDALRRPYSVELADGGRAIQRRDKQSEREREAQVSAEQEELRARAKAYRRRLARRR